MRDAEGLPKGSEHQWGIHRAWGLRRFQRFPGQGPAESSIKQSAFYPPPIWSEGDSGPLTSSKPDQGELEGVR